MRKLLVGTLVCMFSSVWAQSPLAPALNFNVFLNKGARLVTNETDGPMAMGGDLHVSGFYQVATNNAGNFVFGNTPLSLVVGGKVNYTNGILQINQNGYLKIGDSTGSHVWYRDLNNAASPIRITPGVNYNSASRIQLQANAVQLGVSQTQNPVFGNSGINFTQAFNQLRINSASLSVCTNNAQLTTANGIPCSNTNLPSQIYLSLQNGINVLNVNGSDLNRARILTYKQQPNANRIVIINVNAPGTFNWDVWTQAGVGIAQCPYILYNFYNTTTLNIVGSATVEGSVLAPMADVNKSVNQSNIEGQLIAQSFYHSGGEVHYVPFLGNTPGCANPTVALFGINKVEQCVYENEYLFVSLNNGTPPFTYFWDFGDGTTSNIANPSKVYTDPGIYTITHVLNGLAGPDTVIQQIEVVDKPTVGFSINDSIQEITGNFFEYTTLTDLPGYTYDWRYGDGSPYGTSVNTSKVYQATGPYFVCQIVTDTYGCTDTAFAWVVVTSDSVGSGNGGGLESERLGGLVGLREFNFSKNSINRKVNYTLLPMFKGESTRLGKKTAQLTLQDMIPTSLETGDVLRITTPSDLVNITSALEVISVDYTRNNRAKAVVLGIKTKNKPYSHTKYICDRLKGATLLQIDTITIKGYQFHKYVLRQFDGTMEFGISFVVGKSETTTSHTLQTNWLLSEIQPEDTLFNFQVWSSLPENTIKLVGDMIDIITNASTLVQTNQVMAPKVYVTKGYRKGAKMVLHVRNQLAKTVQAQFAFEEILNEQAMLTQRNINYTIEPSDDKVLEVLVNDGYEYNANIFLDTMITDVIYFADGNWGLDYDRAYTTITRYVTSNEPTRVYQTNELAVYRHAAVTAMTDDYIMLFKGVSQGNMPTNLTAYNYVEFFAAGTGTAEFTLVRDSIVNWNEQFKTTLTLVPEGKLYTIPFSSFVSTKAGLIFNPTDVRLLTFSRGYQAQSGLETIDLAIGSVTFKSATTGLVTKQTSLVGNAAVTPNPNSGDFTLSFTTEQSGMATIEVVDVLGRIVQSKNLLLTPGEQQIPMQLDKQYRGLLFARVSSFTGQSAVVKFIVE